MNFDDFKKYCESGNVIPVYRKFLADLLTPVSAFLRLQTLSSRSFLLESVEGGEKTARFSFLGSDPLFTIRFSNSIIEEERNGVKSIHEGDIFEYLRKLFQTYQAVHPSGLPRFAGGIVGYFGYETIRYIENVPTKTDSNPDIPEALFMLFDTILAFDHITHHIYIIRNVFLNDNDIPLEQHYTEALARIESVKDVLYSEHHVASQKNGLVKEEVSSTFSKARFTSAVTKAQEFIRLGDVFQVVLAQKFRKQIDVSPFDIYRALRVINPSPYLYFLQIDDLAIIGSSPELLVRVDNGLVEVRPIAGTRPRGKTEKEDTKLARELQADEKEQAEHLMLVDLGRNDLGRVCDFGSVDVNEFMTTEKYSHVMHMVSNVRGTLRNEMTAIDALTACFPAGTVSGAPKIRAMEIIAELEPENRGVYSGALGYFDFSGNMDTCIAIRTIVTTGNDAVFQAGAGIVADSVPDKEFQETLDKAAALRAAIEFAEGGLV